MPIVAKQCGIKFDPPSVILIYEKKHTNKLRKRVMPIRSFSQYSDCNRAAERLKHHPRHGVYLDSVPLEQLVRLHNVFRDHLRGLSVEESLREQCRSRTNEDDLNRLSDEELKRHKEQMDLLFELNRRRKDDPDFVYDLEVEFPEKSVQETCSWDQSDEEF